MTLMRIRMELGRTEGFPDGSARHGYEFVAPLTQDGRIDSKVWHDVRSRCTVRRFWGDEAEESGVLHHAGHGWRFEYPGRDTSDEEPIFKLDQHRIVPDTYISVTEHDGVRRPFKIVSIMPERVA